MAEHRDRPHQQLQVHAHTGGVTYPGQKDAVGLGPHANTTAGSGPSASKVVAVVTLLPVAGTLLALAGMTLVGTLVGLVVALPLMVIFSPVLVPAAFLAGLAVMAFLASGALGVTGLSSLSWVVGYMREAAQRHLPEQVDDTKRRMADVAAFVGQKTKETGQTIQQKAQESGGRT